MDVVEQVADLDVPMIMFTGGEPFMRGDIEELGLAAHRRGLLTGIVTNGTLLNERRIEKMREAFDLVLFSLDGFEKTHDAMRGVPGTFERSTRAMANLTGNVRKCRIGINLALTNGNTEEATALFRYAKGLGADFVLFQPGFSCGEMMLDPRAASSFASQVLQEKEEYGDFILTSRSFIDRLSTAERQQICDAGRLYIGMDPYGNVYACPILTPKFKAGSVRENSLDTILHSQAMEEAISRGAGCSCLSGCTTLVSLTFKKKVTEYPKLIPEYLALYNKLFQ